MMGVATHPMGRRRPGLVLLPVAVAAMLASCAPRPTVTVPLTRGAREAVYRSRLLQRERGAGMVVERGTLWPRGAAPCDTCPPVRLPALTAELTVQAPESSRLRIGSSFGTALDLAVRGDSLTAYVPALDLAACLDAVCDSFGPPRPGRLAVRLVAATWLPPDSLASASAWDGDRLVLRWREGDDSLAVAVDAAGLPARVRLWREHGPDLHVDYERWEVTEGVAWPVAWRLEGAAGGPGLTCRVDRVWLRRPPDARQLAVRIPDDAERIGAGELRRLLAEAGWAP